MNRPRVIFLSIIIVFAIIALPFFFIIIPAHEKHNFLNKEEKILKIAEKKSDKISKAMRDNLEKSAFLQSKLQEKSLLIFIEEALNVSRLSIDSIKPDQGNEHDEIQVTLRGEFRALLNFFSLISKQPNFVEFIDLVISRNQIKMTFKSNDAGFLSLNNRHHSVFLKRLSFALIPIEVPVFSVIPEPLLDNVQSPFAPRKASQKKDDTFQSIGESTWYLMGEVRQQGMLLGVFLETQNHSRSHYFGIGLPWEDGDWYVMNIEQNTILFENSKYHNHWSLLYR